MKTGPTRAAPTGRIPVTLIGGYLGAGKTSLLNHLLTHAGGERMAVLVNDFGELGLDAALVARRDAETVTLTNGCVCCTIADDFGTALDAQVHAPEPPARIVVETSGVADPGKSARYALGWPGVRLDAVITVVDLEMVRAQAKDRFVGDLIVRQIASADLLVANKSDRIEPSARRSTTDWLAWHAPRAGLVETCHGRVAPAIVLGVDGAEPAPPAARTGNGEAHRGRKGPAVASGPAETHEPAGARDPARTRGPTETCEPGGSDAHPTTGGDTAMPFVHVSCRMSEPFDRTRLASALDSLPGTVVRFKGLVRLQERPDRPFVLQGVGRRWSLEPAPRQAPAALGVDDDSVIDFIGVGPSAPIESAVHGIAPILRRRSWRRR